MGRRGTLGGNGMCFYTGDQFPEEGRVMLYHMVLEQFGQVGYCVTSFFEDGHPFESWYVNFDRRGGDLDVSGLRGRRGWFFHQRRQRRYGISLVVKINTGKRRKA